VDEIIEYYGLKTRKETKPFTALANMVAATKILRQEVQQSISK